MSRNLELFVIVVPEALNADYVSALVEYAKEMGCDVSEARAQADSLMAGFAIRRLRRETKSYAAFGRKMGWS